MASPHHQHHYHLCIRTIHQIPEVYHAAEWTHHRHPLIKTLLYPCEFFGFLFFFFIGEDRHLVRLSFLRSCMQLVKNYAKSQTLLFTTASWPPLRGALELDLEVLIAFHCFGNSTQRLQSNLFPFVSQ